MQNLVYVICMYGWYVYPLNAHAGNFKQALLYACLVSRAIGSQNAVALMLRKLLLLEGS